MLSKYWSEIMHCIWIFFFKSNTEIGEIDGFSTDEEKDYDGLECHSDSLPR